MARKRFFILCFLISLLLVPAASAAEPPAYRLLVLHSYAMDYQWTEGLHQGITQSLQAESPLSQFRIEFMDTKNFFSPEYLESLAATYRHKYAGVALDGILVTDNNALDFITRYGQKLFPDVPVVACGINNATPPPAESQIKSIIAEESDHIGTIRQAQRFWPEGKTLFVIYDETPTGAHIAREIEQVLAEHPLSFRVELMTGETLAELKQFAASRKPQDLLYLLPFFRDASGQVFAQGQVARELATVSTVPMLATWSFQVGTGVIGGHVISPQHLGEFAVTTLLRLLGGQAVEPIQSSRSVFESRYDYQVVQQFDIDEKLLPAEVVFINKPLGFYQRHRDVLLPAAGLVGVLALIATLLGLNLQKQRTINVTNLQLLALDKEIIETQRELVSTLGEVIEVRSKETGNHVKRVAKLSRLIGEKVGLDEPQLEMLEAASPMHDVGKIGVPERILHKLGRLTEQEFEVVKTHTDIGKELLGASDRELMQTAGIIAYQHHERWDGSGYPNGLRGEEISILARITMLADIYDALSSERSYKDVWPEEKILKYIKSERGKYFDPLLVDIFLENLDEARAIRARYAETETGKE